MINERINIPQADMLMGSMRSMGYSFESAIADVIDNSISANARTVRVFFPTSPLENQTVGILDDGVGMENEVLFEAMRYGSSSSEDIRKDNDLGRFGLGLKSASLSQCRILTVVSIFDDEISAYKWDYNYVKKTKNWTLLSLSKEDCSKLPYINYLKEQNCGTLVLWSDFDILSKANDGQVYNALDNLKEVVSSHMSLIFHRFMRRSKNKIVMYVNNQKLKPLDPFLESHPKTTTLKEKTIAVNDSYGKEQHIHIKPFILPYLSDMSNKEKKLMGGVEDMRTRQGFYVYRNERLIIWGNWFRMTRRNELTKNARIRVDIPNSLDRPELIGCFSAFSEDLLESIENETDDSCIYKTMSSRYQAWRKLFKPTRTSLSENEIMGLIGELLFLRDYAIPHWGIDAALDSWTGLEKTHKDFSIGNDWFEVKSVSTGKETVRISSIEQLDSDVPGILYIYSLEKMSPSFNGVKLNAIVRGLLSSFNLVQKDNLINKLETYGYDFDPAFDNYVYVISDETAYNVINDFPRLVRTEVPLAISKVQYDIIITEIIPYKTQLK